MEIPAEELLTKLKHRVKVDGEELEVTLAELQAGYQKDRDYRHKTEALKREREAFQAHATQLARQYEAEAAQFGEYLQAITHTIIGELNSQEMAQLRAENPTEWIVRREDYNDRLRRIDAIRQQAAAQWHARTTQARQQQEQQLRAHLQEQAAMLEKKIPNWGPDSRDALNRYLTTDLRIPCPPLPPK